MQSILNRVARSNQVAQQFLEYIGIQDERHTVGKIIYLFNIMDPAHERYKSTATYVETATTARNIS
jgi:dihydroorotate dehydrogenase